MMLVMRDDDFFIFSEVDKINFPRNNLLLGDPAAVVVVNAEVKDLSSLVE